MPRSKCHKCHNRQMPQMPQRKLLKMLSLQAGANSGGLKKMATITSTDCDSTKAGLQGRAGKSRQQLKPNATTGKARDATKKAGRRQNDIEVALSILQTAFDQFLEAGGSSGISSGGGHLTLTIAGVQVCGICQLWTTEKACPVCG